MHLVLYLRGLPQWVTLWEAMAQSQFFKWRRIIKKTKKQDIVLVQAGLRKSVLGTYEYIFPEESLATVLSMMRKTDRGSLDVKNTFKQRARLAVLRKIIGLKKIPEAVFKKAKKIPESITINASERGVSHLCLPKVSVHIIGIKKDDRGEMTNPVDKTTYLQELL